MRALRPPGAEWTLHAAPPRTRFDDYDTRSRRLAFCSPRPTGTAGACGRTGVKVRPCSDGLLSPLFPDTGAPGSKSSLNTCRDRQFQSRVGGVRPGRPAGGGGGGWGPPLDKDPLQGGPTSCARVATSLPEPQDEDRVPAAVCCLPDEASGRLGPCPTWPGQSRAPVWHAQTPCSLTSFIWGMGGAQGERYSSLTHLRTLTPFRLFRRKDLHSSRKGCKGPQTSGVSSADAPEHEPPTELTRAHADAPAWADATSSLYF